MVNQTRQVIYEIVYVMQIDGEWQYVFRIQQNFKMRSKSTFKPGMTHFL